jgi:hypothetical protein
MRIFIIILSAITFFAACRPAKKVQKIQTAISKIDTTPIIVS